MARLESPQESLLARLCEASRNQPPDQRTSFMAFRHLGGQVITHPQLGDIGDFHWGDLQVLERYSLIFITNRSQNDLGFDVSPEGFAHWEATQRALGEGTERIVAEVRSLLDSKRFRDAYPEAFAKWVQAEDLLWSADAQQELSTLGHHCREAMQIFAAGFCHRVGIEPPGLPTDTVKRVRAGLDLLKAKSETRALMLDALLAYWGTVSDLAQRQEHAAAKEGTGITWDDGRAVVFQTALVMFELARAADSV